MSYISPIDLFYTDMQTQLENDVVKAVCGYNINVDKEELIKALNYDRGQYNAGYKDGYEDALQEVIRTISEEHYNPMASIDILTLVARMKKESEASI